MTWTQPSFRNAPTAYLRANNLLQKQPVYYCKFGLVTGPGGTNSQVLPNQYATGPILNQTASRKRYMSPPRAFSSQINPVTFMGTLGQMTFDLFDLNGEITNMVASYIMKNRYVTIYRGFEFLNETDYVPIYSGQVFNWQLSQDGTYYTFTVVDPLKMATAAILNGHTSLVSDFTVGSSFGDNTVTWQYIGSQAAPPWAASTVYAVGALVSNFGATFKCTTAGTSSGAGGPSLPQTIVVSSVYGFSSATDMNDGQGPRNFLKIDNNLFSYTGLSGGTIPDGSVVWQFTGAYGAAGGSVTNWQSNHAYTVGDEVTNNNHIYVCATAGTSAPSGGPAGAGITGGQSFLGVTCVTVNNNGEALAQTHQAGATVDNYVLYQGNPVTVMLQVLMSTGTGTNWSGSGTNYDVLPPGQGIGIPYTSINISNIETQRSRYVADLVFSGYFKDQAQGIKFIQENILQQALCFLFTNVNGQVDVNFPYPAGQLDAVTLDDSNVVGNPMFDAHLATGGYFYNDVDVSYDYQPVGDFFAKEDVMLDGVSLVNYREDSKLSINAKMVASYYAGLSVVRRMQSLYLKFFSSPPPVITAKTFDAFHLLNPGSIVYWSHSKTPNYQTGQRGGTIFCMVINAQPDYFSGAMNVTLLGLGFYQQKKYARWSPTSSLNGGQFPVFTGATALQKRYGFWGNKTGVYAQMSDGSDGYYWGP